MASVRVSRSLLAAAVLTIVAGLVQIAATYMLAGLAAAFGSAGGHGTVFRSDTIAGMAVGALSIVSAIAALRRSSHASRIIAVSIAASAAFHAVVIAGELGEHGAWPELSLWALVQIVPLVLLALAARPRAPTPPHGT